MELTARSKAYTGSELKHISLIKPREPRRKSEQSTGDRDYPEMRSIFQIFLIRKATYLYFKSFYYASYGINIKFETLHIIFLLNYYFQYY